MISGVRDMRITRVAAEQVLDRGGGDGGARPQRVDRDALPRSSPAKPSTTRLMPNFAIE